jgi:hypothetical protein
LTSDHAEQAAPAVAVFRNQPILVAKSVLIEVVARLRHT